MASAQGLDASEMVDDALARGTHTVAKLVRRHFGVIQWVVVVVIAGGIGLAIYRHRTQSQHEKASDALMKGVVAQNGKLLSQSLEDATRDTGVEDPRPSYSSAEARLKAATEAYRAALEQHPGATSTVLVKLALAGTLFDQHKYKEALTLFEEVQNSKTALQDGDVKGRAIEGVGLCQEALGNKKAALKAFRGLENTDIVGFGPLGKYHQARLLVSDNKPDQAKQLLLKAKEKLEKDDLSNPNNPQAQGYLALAIQQLLETIDPSQRPTPAQQLSNMTPEKMAALKKWIEGGAKGPMPGMPQGAPQPVPPASKKKAGTGGSAPTAPGGSSAP